MKPLAIAAGGGLAATFTTLQATAGTTAAVQTVAALVGGATVGGILIYLIRRLNALPAEEGLKRHDAVDRINQTMLEQYDRLDETVSQQYTRLDESLQRMEARLTGAIEAGTAREATERHRLEDRVRELERR